MAAGKGRRVSFGAGDWSPESMQAILLSIYKNEAKKIPEVYRTYQKAADEFAELPSLKAVRMRWKKIQKL